jgi:hypothetical protein
VELELTSNSSSDKSNEILSGGKTCHYRVKLQCFRDYMSVCVSIYIYIYILCESSDSHGCSYEDGRQSSGILCRVVSQKLLDILDVLIAFIIRVIDGNVDQLL